MSGTGNCYDNAVSESFFSRFKDELGDTFPSRHQCRLDCFEFIEVFHNRQRRHSYNGNLTPFETEQFFNRHGRRPRGVIDFRDNYELGAENILTGEATSSRTSEIAIPDSPRYTLSAEEGLRLPY